MRKRFLFALLAFTVVGVGFWLGIRRVPEPAPVVSPPGPTGPPAPTSAVRRVDMKKQTYDIMYVPSLDEYAIVVYGSPFEPARKEAEQAFLQKLGVAPEQACRLRVTVSTPVFVNPEESKQTYRLGFCSP
ncbi:hypothetical protein HY950_00235 [Candidatus Gottesmanbacteria bacterium]|nr:hypothetical protein [Candidatus Gottesmanbacteria bacterium]